MTKVRKSNFELLRIIAMILIVVSHYVEWLGPFFSDEVMSCNRVFSQVLRFGGGCGNILFFLISGYFFSDSANNRKRIFGLWLEMVFYSMLCIIIAYILQGEVSISALISACFPFAHGEYWFMTAYLILMILMPWIGMVITNMDGRQYRELLVILLIITSIIPNIPGCPTTVISDVGFYLFIYLAGAYIRRYPNKYFDNVKWNLFIGLVSISIITGTIIVFDFLGIQHKAFVEYALYFTRMRSIFVLLFAMTFFCVFKNIEIKNSKFINYISGSMLAVYLVHNNKNIRSIMWENILKNVQYDSPYLYIHLLITLGGIFAVCLLMDIFRREIIFKLLGGLIWKNRKERK